MINKSFWKDRRVFITGHTGFKGSWLCLWLHSLGARVTGYALNPPTDPSLFALCNIDRIVGSIIGDIRSDQLLNKTILDAKPEVVIHMAAQPLVRESYRDPVGTYAVNVMGTVNLLETIRKCKDVKAVISVTSDKCYENKEWHWGYRESDPIGGYDPYSSSKACAELVTSSYRNSFFNPEAYDAHVVGIATARAGNVIGGGDWSADRLVPDCVRALLKGEKVIIRNPASVRPWQHVLEPLIGYLMLAERLYADGRRFVGAWNFGPESGDVMSVEGLTKRICEMWRHGASYEVDVEDHPHESHCLKLDCSKTMAELGWRPRWNLEQALNKIMEWTLAYKEGKDLKEICLKQIEEYCGTC